MSYLNIIIGPMFSGKTTELINLYTNSIYNKKVIINHNIDKRYTDESSVTSHDKVSLPAISMTQLDDILHNDIILSNEEFYIDESQFFPDLFKVVTKLLDYNKRIFLCGLDGDFKKIPFNDGEILKLIPYCNDIQKLHAKCYICGQNASYTKRLVKNNNEQILVGTDEMYQPSCYIHHFNY